MSTENWLNVIDQIPEKSRITLTGGEPLVFQDFDKIFSKANNIAETNIVTNVTRKVDPDYSISPKVPVSLALFLVKNHWHQR